MKYEIVLVLGAFMLLVLPSAATDCRECHQNTIPVDVSDTIIMNDQTCFSCHNPGYPPQYMGLDVHGIHENNIIIGSIEDYIIRHPVTDLDCITCHQHEYECIDCHIPHIKDRADCTHCHNTVTNLFKHQTINLTRHDIMGTGAPAACDVCHSSAEGLLRLSSGRKITLDSSHELCRQCHSTIYRQWENGEHWMGPEELEGACSYCHDVHAPELLYWEPQRSKNELILNRSIIFLITGLSLIFIIIFALKTLRSRK